MAPRMQRRQQLLRKMARIPPAIRSAIRQALAEGADEIVALQKHLVPVRTGKLRDSIRQHWGDLPDLGTSAALSGGGGVKGDPDLTVHITAGGGSRDEGWYARWVEYGTAPHINQGKFPGTQHPGAPAQPFFMPAYRALRKRVKSRITRATKKAIRNAAGTQ